MDDLSLTLGRIEGKLDGAINGQARHERWLEEHEKRITAIEHFRTSSLVYGGVAIFLLSLLSNFLVRKAALL